MTPCRRSARREGSALVFALWIALLVGVLGTVAMRLAAAGAGASRIEVDLAAARAAAEGGIWAAAHRLALQEPAARPPSAAFAFPLGRSEVAVQAADEEGRVDLNAAPEPLLAALFRAVGVEERAAGVLAGQVVEWRTQSPAQRMPAGDAREADQRRPTFRSTSDLAAIPGVTPALVAAVRDGVTVHTGRSWPARSSAPPLVQAALLQADDARSTMPARAGVLRTPSASSGEAGRRVIWRIEARAQTGAVEARVTAVVNVAAANGVLGRVLEWQPVHP
ncbi:general secretion pathway protein GspK [Roseomonas populi]|uniref:General secretion pathway protein GspK n=1 Tax=Roseomonas populi TaxID=3121582 RepID=A0ABT1X926_9PROT|nr:general secretion pathway protein GspK [Roseomonas pecuniae]MCR0983627.1 general secretion pathway protein GspK [Roseomonas pecuniae]